MLSLLKNLDRWQTKSELWREKLLYPLLVTAKNIGLGANGIAHLRLLLALAFPFLVFASLRWALACIILSILLDAVDGSVARFNHQASDRGKFIDVLVDEITFVCLAVGSMKLFMPLSLALASSAGAISFVYIMAAINKNEKIASDWLFRAKVQLTIYKILYIIIIVGLGLQYLTIAYAEKLLWSLAILAALHFFFHYFSFIYKKS